MPERLHYTSIILFDRLIAINLLLANDKWANLIFADKSIDDNKLFGRFRCVRWILDCKLISFNLFSFKFRTIKFGYYYSLTSVNFLLDNFSYVSGLYL